MPNASSVGQLLAATILSLGATNPPTRVAWLLIAAPALALPSSAEDPSPVIPITSNGSFTIQGESYPHTTFLFYFRCVCSQQKCVAAA